MNEITRYDQELAAQLQKLPMPTEETAWAEMEKLLNEDDEDPVIVPFYRRWGCLLFGLLAGLLLAVGGWWYFKKDAKTSEDSLLAKNELIIAYDTADIRKHLSNTSTPDSNDISIPMKKADSSANIFSTDLGEDVKAGKAVSRAGVTKPPTKIQSAAAVATTNNPGKNPTRSNRSSAKAKQKTNISPGDIEAQLIGNSTDSQMSDVKTTTTTEDLKLSDSNLVISTSGNETEKNNSTATLKDSIDSVKDSSKMPTSTSDKEAEKKPKKNNWTVAAGLSIYQPIKLNGEPSVPYNFYGRKGTLTDYIPSVYLRLYRNNKWYLHTEFRYGAPQNVKPFEYKKQVIDSSNVNFITANYRLRKTYYHQVPLSLHYFILPKLSIGAGVILNHFTGALADMDVYKRVGGQTDSLQSSELINDKKDSRFSMNHLQWSAEVNYNWKRFFVGARFSRDINPYIKYTDNITGVAMEKKMQALNILLRYELWRSKKKN